MSDPDQTAGAGSLTPQAISIVVPSMSAGGTEHVVSLISRHWCEAGHRVCIITFETRGTSSYYPLDHRTELIQLDCPMTRVGPISSLADTIARVRLLRAALVRARPDFVLSFLTRTNVMTLTAAIGMPCPIVVSERNNPGVQPFGQFWKNLRRLLYPRAFRIVTMTKGALQFFPASIRQRGTVIPNALNLPSSWSNQRGTNTLTAVGRLTGQKGFDLLITAFARIAGRHPEWKLVIWGEGEERTALRALAVELGIAHQVTMPGLTRRPLEWVETADVFVLSSRYEGWGIVLLEAMGSGLPVISFNCKWGPAEMITHGHDGLLVEDGNVDALADSLDKVLSDATLRDRLACNAKHSSAAFSRSRVLAAWDELLMLACNAQFGQSRENSPL
jgi:glycosyltransferase involved in cell wall biosynthesis